MPYPTPFPGWAPKLLTGDPEVDNEHRLLLKIVARLHEVCPEYEQRADCSGCPAAQLARCRDDLVNTLGELLGFLVDHFFAEEQAMRDLGLTVTNKQLCDRHKEDHAAISDTVLRIVASLDLPQTVVLIGQLHSVLQTWVRHHIELHGATLPPMIRRT